MGAGEAVRLFAVFYLRDTPRRFAECGKHHSTSRRRRQGPRVEAPQSARTASRIAPRGLAPAVIPLDGSARPSGLYAAPAAAPRATPTTPIQDAPAPRRFAPPPLRAEASASALRTCAAGSSKANGISGNASATRPSASRHGRICYRRQPRRRLSPRRSCFNDTTSPRRAKGERRITRLMLYRFFPPSARRPRPAPIRKKAKFRDFARTSHFSRAEVPRHASAPAKSVTQRSC